MLIPSCPSYYSNGYQNHLQERRHLRVPDHPGFLIRGTCPLLDRGALEEEAYHDVMIESRERQNPHGCCQLGASASL